MSRMSRTGCLLTAALGFALFGCSDDEVKSDLNAEGPPHIVIVSAMTATGYATRAGSGYIRGEQAIYCSQNADDKVNATYCPEGAPEVAQNIDVLPLAFISLPYTGTYTQTMADAATPPEGNWYIRLVFNEHLDPDKIETLVPAGNDTFDNPISAGSLAETQPVNLACGGNAVRYDGWYDPSGSHLSDPAGPSLIVQALDYVAPGADCEVSLITDKFTDKDSNTLSGTDRFQFNLAPLSVFKTGATSYRHSPSNEAEDVSPKVTVKITFNGPVDPATLANNITLEANPDQNPQPPAPDFNLELEEVKREGQESLRRVNVVALTLNADLAENADYTVKVANTGIKDLLGAADISGDEVTFSFKTGTTPAN